MDAGSTYVADRTLDDSDSTDTPVSADVSADAFVDVLETGVEEVISLVDGDAVAIVKIEVSSGS
ncbi:unnamed protein product [Gongylonema pulchrum]|uniref:HalOD1 domain-containing protein n=1 Tax=Gongylonema pulchrum TaxID=637853 RepID=A0A183D5T3_9BILA|nr:unnamed protein product [Gongylonema pulchrum]